MSAVRVTRGAQAMKNYLLQGNKRALDNEGNNCTFDVM